MPSGFDMSALLTLLLMFFIIAGGIFLLIRTIVLWYFRINQMADNLKAIADSQPYILEALQDIVQKLPDPSRPDNANKNGDATSN